MDSFFPTVEGYYYWTPRPGAPITIVRVVHIFGVGLCFRTRGVAYRRAENDGSWHGMVPTPVELAQLVADAYQRGREVHPFPDMAWGEDQNQIYARLLKFVPRALAAATVLDGSEKGNNEGEQRER